MNVPETFESWNARQQGDPEEIGFLQALRFAYLSGQDSVLKAQTAVAKGEPIAKVKHEFENCIGWNPKIDPNTIDEDTPLFLSPPAVAVNEQLLKDAERYRWLRDSKHDLALVIYKRTKWVPEDVPVPGVGVYWEYKYRSDEDLDLAIDSAIAQAEAAKGGV